MATSVGVGRGAVGAADALAITDAVRTGTTVGEGNAVAADDGLGRKLIGLVDVGDCCAVCVPHPTISSSPSPPTSLAHK